MNTKELVQLYIHEQIKIAEIFPVTEVDKLSKLIIEAYEKSRTVYLAGNGGNAAFCDNFFGDLYHLPFVTDDKTKALSENLKKIKVVNLAVSAAVVTGLMNDFGTEFIFSQQIEAHITKGDILIGFTGSGNSGNIIKAFEMAKKYDATTVAITRGDGGKSKKFADLCIIIPGTSQFPGQIGKNNNNFHFEDYLSSISHIVTGILQKYVREKYGYTN